MGGMAALHSSMPAKLPYSRVISRSLGLPQNSPLFCHLIRVPLVPLNHTHSLSSFFERVLLSSILHGTDRDQVFPG